MLLGWQPAPMGLMWRSIVYWRALLQDASKLRSPWLTASQVARYPVCKGSASPNYPLPTLLGSNPILPQLAGHRDLRVEKLRQPAE